MARKPLAKPATRSLSPFLGAVCDFVRAAHIRQFQTAVLKALAKSSRHDAQPSVLFLADSFAFETRGGDGVRIGLLFVRDQRGVLRRRRGQYLIAEVGNLGRYSRIL
jgi:hypothetical protein